MGQLADRAEFEVDHIDLRDYPLPFFDGTAPARSPRVYGSRELEQLGGRLDRADGFIALTGLGGDINLATTDGVPDVLHTDAVPEGHTTETRSPVRRATVAFERIRGYALPRAESKDFIMKVADERWNS